MRRGNFFRTWGKVVEWPAPRYETKITGLPRGLPPGNYAVRLQDVDYSEVENRVLATFAFDVDAFAKLCDDPETKFIEIDSLSAMGGCLTGRFHNPKAD